MQVMSVDETCQYLKVGKTKLYALIKESAIPAKKLGKKTIILQQDADLYLNSLPAITINQRG